MKKLFLAALVCCLTTLAFAEAGPICDGLLGDENATSGQYVPARVKWTTDADGNVNITILPFSKAEETAEKPTAWRGRGMADNLNADKGWEMTINGVKLSPRSTPQKKGFRGKIAILIDNDSGSTSEIFAAAMQDTGQARLFGSATPGKCLPSQIITMPDGSRLQTIFGDIRRPDGRRIEGIGVIPDVSCPPEKAVELAIQWIDETSFFEEIFKWWN